MHSTRALAESADFGYARQGVEEIPCSDAARAFLIAIEEGVSTGKVYGRSPGLRLIIPDHFYLQDFAAPVPELSGILDPEAHEIALIAFRDSAVDAGTVFKLGY